MKKLSYSILVIIQVLLAVSFFRFRFIPESMIWSGTNMLLNVAVTFFLLFAILLWGICNERKKKNQKLSPLALAMLIISVLLIIGSTLFIGLADRTFSTGFYDHCVILFVITILQCIKTAVYIHLWMN